MDKRFTIHILVSKTVLDITPSNDLTGTKAVAEKATGFQVLSCRVYDSFAEDPLIFWSKNGKIIIPFKDR